MSYQKILMPMYLENNRFCNVLDLMSDELNDYSMIIDTEEPVLSSYIMQLSQMNRKHAEDLRNCFTNNGGIIGRKMHNGKMAEDKIIEGFLKNHEELLEITTNYIGTKIKKKLDRSDVSPFNKAAVLAFVENCEEAKYEEMLRTIYNKYLYSYENSFT